MATGHAGVRSVTMARPRLVRLLAWIGIPIAVIAVVALVWRWDWLIPIVESKASASLGRPVSIGHLHVALGRTITVTADDVVVGNPPDWPDRNSPLADVTRLTVQADAWGYITGKGLNLPLIALEHPVVEAAETQDGKSNFKFSSGGGGGPTPKIGRLVINDGDVHVVMPSLKADFRGQIATRDAEGNDGGQIIANAKGTYAGQPIEARMVGGALLSLREPGTPWPIDLTLANGPTRVSLKGTLQDPVALAGADLTLKASGPDMGLLEPLSGFPIPKTPPYQISTKIDLVRMERVRLTDFHGRLGSSDVNGSVEVDFGNGAGAKARPVATLDLQSKRVDLVDFAGFLGGTPVRTNTAGITPEQREDARKAEADPKLLPEKPIKVPRLTWADVHVNYRGAHILGRNVPLDDVAVRMDLVDGTINVHPVSFGVGKGKLLANANIVPTSNTQVRAKADIRLENLDVSRLMAATHTFQGSGTISGVGAFEGVGNSVATLAGNGNGGVKMAMSGGDLSALLVYLSGLQFGNALLSALGIPDRTPVECFIGDLALQKGVVDLQAMTLQTKDSIVNVDGTISLAKETLDLALKTDARHFSVGSLPTRINIGGTLKHPRILPGAEVAARAGAAAGLGVLFAPLALLPTVQLGTSADEDARCGALLRQARAAAGGKALPAPQRHAEERPAR